ncbi:hypothetical protein PV08_06321 [Exophiala spinifera]|uniref:Uncharacterized protein n=1 Tax=Exophiala spinifera TaxID=91928 RepID=A0A0D2BCB8_9EURO|nr:uncharacterized protein PV08_06321 [Exophiala spinifera]KIW16270.1 hypothetical protein PV08_06321 [Exophiala spinifera]
MEDALGEEGEEEKLWFGGKARGMSDLMMIFPMDMADQRGYFDGTKYPQGSELVGSNSQSPGLQESDGKGWQVQSQDVPGNNNFYHIYHCPVQSTSIVFIE